MIQLKKGLLPAREQLLELYGSVGWTAYTEHPDRLERGLANSLAVYTAWERDCLVGLLRAVGDGETILYIQDLLVRPDCQGQGVGRRLMAAVEADFSAVRQMVLLTDGTPATLSFYRACGWRQAEEWGCAAFVKI